jgi:2-oxoglutarate dehydrogenase E2 component (dihydrolipoamide succinyltransferase)
MAKLPATPSAAVQAAGAAQAPAVQTPWGGTSDPAIAAPAAAQPPAAPQEPAPVTPAASEPTTPAANAPVTSEVTVNGPVEGGNDEAGADLSEAELVKADLEEARQRLGAILDAQARVQKALAAATAEVDALSKEYDKLVPPPTFQNHLQHYQATQARLREERAARLVNIRKAGVNLKDLLGDLKAPIDQAMSRKTSRGTKRPDPHKL